MIRLFLILLSFLCFLSCDDITSENIDKEIDTVFTVDTLILFDTIIGDTVTDDIYEPDDTYLLANTLILDETQKHIIRPGNSDWIMFHGDSGKGYYVYISNRDDKYHNLLFYTFLQPNGINDQTYTTAYQTEMKIMKFVPSVSGLFALKVSPKNDTTKYFYEIQYREVAVGEADVYEPNNKSSNASEISIGDTTNHTLTLNDIDYISYSVDSGKYYEVILNTGDNSKSYFTNYTIKSESTKKSVQTHYTAMGNHQKGYIAEQDDIHILSISNVYGSKDSYTLIVDTIPMGKKDSYEPDNNLTEAKELLIPILKQARTFTIKDKDCFWFTPDSGKVYKITIDCAITSSLLRAYITIGNSYPGTETYFKDNKVVIHTAPLSADRHDCELYLNSYDSSNYFLSIDTLFPGIPDSYEPDNDLSSAITLSTDSIVQEHTLTNMDVDWFAVSVIEGASYELKLDSDLSIPFKFKSNELNNSGTLSKNNPFTWIASQTEVVNFMLYRGGIGDYTISCIKK